MLLNKKWVNLEIKEETKRYLEANENKNKTSQNVWDTTKAILRGKFKALRLTSRKMETLKQPNLTLKGTRKIKTKPKVCWEKEIINTRVEK